MPIENDSKKLAILKINDHFHYEVWLHIFENYGEFDKVNLAKVADEFRLPDGYMKKIWLDLKSANLIEIDKSERKRELKQIKKFKESLDKLISSCPTLFAYGDFDGKFLSTLFEGVLGGYIDNSKTKKEQKIITKRKIRARHRKDIYERDKYRCLHCGTHKNLTIDHIYPISLGGEDVIDNYQTLCLPCNSRKGNKIKNNTEVKNEMVSP